MKKTISLLITLVLLLSLLTGCGSTASNSNSEAKTESTTASSAAADSTNENAAEAAQADASAAEEVEEVEVRKIVAETDEAVREDVLNIVCEYTGKEKDYVETCLYGGVTKFAVDPNTAGIVKYVEAAYNSGALAGNATDFGSYDITQNVDTGAYYQALTDLIEREPDNAFYKELLEQFNGAN